MPGGGGGGTQPDSAAAGSIVFAFRCDSPAPMPDIIRVSFGGFDLHKLFAWPGFCFFLYTLSQGGGGPVWAAIWKKLPILKQGH